MSAVKMSAVKMSAVKTAVTVEDAISMFGRLADSQHVFASPIRTAASGFEFSSNTAIKPKWIIAYVSREPCGEDVDLPVHHSRWSTLLFPDGARTCSRARFDNEIGNAQYVSPLGTPKWSVPGKVLVDASACKAKPSTAALEVLFEALGGDMAEGNLSRDSVLSKLSAWASSDDLGEAVLFSEFASAIGATA